MSPNEKPGTVRHADASKSGEIVEPPAFAVTLSVWQRVGHVCEHNCLMSEPREPRAKSPRAAVALREFLQEESAGAVLLAIGAAVALVWANSWWSASYEELWATHVVLEIPGVALDFSLRHWINDGLMTIFFLVVGLEIKRELTVGHLNSRRAATLPAIAALGGMVVPALIYLALSGATEPRGWAIAVATDIALAVGALSVAGSRVPTSLRAFLLALAIVDDIGGIIVIAVAYSKGVALLWLLGAAAGIVAVLALQRLGARSPLTYVPIGVWMWFALHEAGVHPTIAGVVMGLLAPAVTYREKPLIDWLQHALHPVSSFVVVPIFALANSGISVSLDGLRDAAASPVTWGVGVGLVVGKPLGIVLATLLAIRLRVADMPAGASLRQLVGTGVVAGIGFTVAIFITELALVDAVDLANAKLAILLASLAAAALGLLLLVRSAERNPAP